MHTVVIFLLYVYLRCKFYSKYRNSVALTTGLSKFDVLQKLFFKITTSTDQPISLVSFLLAHVVLLPKELKRVG